MAKTREYVKLWFSYDAYFESYTDEEVGRIVRAMIAYRKNGEQPDFDGGNERFIWPVIKRDIDESRLAQERAAEISRENGKKGGRPRKTPAALPEAPAEGKPEEPEQPKPTETKENLKNQTGFCKSEKKQTETKKEAQKPKKANPAFEAFWKAYPKKVGKAIARRSFERVKVPAETLIAAVNAQKQSQQWTKDNGQYIPNPATWLNQGRWEDELEPPKAAEKKPYTYEYRGIEDSL